VATYAYDFTYTPTTWSRMLDEPADRTPMVAATVAEVGGTLQGLWYGAEDASGLAVIDSPDADTATAILLVLQGSGAFASVRYRRMVAGAELPALAERAAAARRGYVRPGDRAGAPA